MVPNGWEAVEVDNLAKFSSGGTPSKQNEAYWNGTEPWISGKDLKTHYLYSSIDKLTDEGFAVAKKAPKGSTLILVRGMTLLKDFPVGYATRELSFNQDVKALVPSENVDGLYLSFLLSGDKHKIMNLVSIAGHGTGRLDTNLLKQHPINLPPLAEQQKIAKILSTWDKAISTTERLIENSTQQKKALMQQLLTGKKRLLDDEGKRFEGEWEERAVSSLGKIYSGGTPSTSNTEYWDGDINWIIPTDITKQDSRYINSSLRKITQEGLENSSAKLVPAGSLLICSRATIGAMAITSHEMCTNQGFKNIVPNSKTNIEFVYYLLTYNKHRMISKASGSTFLELSKTSFESMKFKVPKLKEQQKIAIVLTNADKEIELLEQQLADLQQEKKALMQVLLTGKKRVVVYG